MTEGPPTPGSQQGTRPQGQPCGRCELRRSVVNSLGVTPLQEPGSCRCGVPEVLPRVSRGALV